LPSLPIPMIAAIVLGYLLLRALIERRVHPSLLVLIGACGAQSAIIALNQHYGMTGLRWLQPVTAACIPPLAWLAFVAVTKRTLRARWDMAHLAGPVLVLAGILIEPAGLDIVIPALFLSYGVAMFAILLVGEESIPQSNLGAGTWPLIIWRMLAGALILSAGTDALIGVLTLRGQTNWTPWIISAGSSLTLLGLGALGLSDAISPPAAHDEADSSDLSPEEREADAALLQRLDTFMADKKPYLDPELTLTRLARKLGVPAKAVSTAINRNRNENVSRYVNRFRIDHACALMRDGANITAAMFESGFNTKSNFNREFLRIKQVSPTDWLMSPTGQGQDQASQAGA
jgi:AraC-like DNA-binding protein